MREDQRQLVAETYDRFGAEVFRYLAMVLGRRDDAENVLQEVFLRLFDVARRDPAALEVRAYVLRVARNEAYRALFQRRGRCPTGGDGFLVVCDPRAGSEAERVALADALAQLPEEQREVVQLKVYMNMTFDEIADFTKVSPNTAASRYRYAVEKLRRVLGE